MSPDYTRPPWIVDESAAGANHVVPPAQHAAAEVPAGTQNGDRRPPLPQHQAPRSVDAPATSAAADLADVLAAEEYRVVEDLRDRVSTRLTVEDKNYAPGARRELTKKLIRDEYDQWLLHQANHGRTAPAASIEDKIFGAVLAELDGLGRLAPLLARGDVEDIHFEGCDDTMLRLKNGDLVPGAPVAGSDEELEQLLRAIGSRSGDGQTSREFSAASPILNVRLKGVTDLGARLQAAMDVLPRPAGVIRVHRFSNPSLDDLRDMDTNMIDTPMHAFLHHAVLAGASILVSGNPGVGKTTLLRSLGNTIPWENVLVTVEDERELGLHLPWWDARTARMIKRHAVSRSFESRLPNAEGMGGFDMGDALHEALRMSTTWIVVGEVRGAYVTYLLEAATSGVASVMCTIHSRTAHGVFKKVKINALKANPAPDPELIMSSLSELDLVVHVHRDRHYDRFVSGIYELGETGDSGKPSLTPIFDDPHKRGGRPIAKGAGALSEDLRAPLEDAGFDAERWLNPEKSPSDWRVARPRGGVGVVIAGVLMLTVAGLVICAGAVGVVTSARGIHLLPERARATSSGPRVKVTPLHMVGVAVGVGVLLLTGWPVAGIGATAGVIFVPSVLGGGKAAKELIAKSEALADWTRRLADLLSSGAAGSTRDALERSLTSAPDPIAGEVRRLVSRMGPQGSESALRRFAAEVNDPAAEKIAGVLILRERNGGPGLADVLTGLAVDLDDRSRMVREVEAERAKPRSNMRTIVVVTGLLVAGMMLFARTFLSGYSSVFGQIMLVVVAGVFAFALRWMRRLSNPVVPSRVLDPSPAVQS